VTASRVSSSVISAALPVEVIDAAELQQRQSLSMADVLRGRNGVAVAQSGPVGGLTELRLRGAEANHTQIRMDGVVLNDPAIGSSVDLAHLNLIGALHDMVIRDDIPIPPDDHAGAEPLLSAFPRGLETPLEFIAKKTSEKRVIEEREGRSFRSFVGFPR